MDSKITKPKFQNESAKRALYFNVISKLKLDTKATKQNLDRKCKSQICRNQKRPKRQQFTMYFKAFNKNEKARILECRSKTGENQKPRKQKSLK